MPQSFTRVDAQHIRARRHAGVDTGMLLIERSERRRRHAGLKRLDGKHRKDLLRTNDTRRNGSVRDMPSRRYQKVEYTTSPAAGSLEAK